MASKLRQERRRREARLAMHRAPDNQVERLQQKVRELATVVTACQTLILQWQEDCKTAWRPDMDSLVTISWRSNQPPVHIEPDVRAAFVRIRTLKQCAEELANVTHSQLLIDGLLTNKFGLGPSVLRTTKSGTITGIS